MTQDKAKQKDWIKNVREALKNSKVGDLEKQEVFALGQKLGYTLNRKEVQFFEMAFYGVGEINYIFDKSGMSKSDFMDAIKNPEN